VLQYRQFNIEQTVGRYIIEGFHSGEIEVMVFWVVALCSLVVGNQCFGGHAATVFSVEVPTTKQPQKP
jgi:hypothetical protein